METGIAAPGSRTSRLRLKQREQQLEALAESRHGEMQKQDRGRSCAAAVPNSGNASKPSRAKPLCA